MKRGMHFGGPKARSKGEFRGIGWSLEYVNEEESLCMWRLAARNNNSPLAVANWGAVVIGLSSAWKYMAQNREEISFFVRQCRLFCKLMGFSPDNKRDVYNVGELIHLRLIDLVNMQPMPQSMSLSPEVVAVEMRDGKPLVILEESRQRH